MATTDPAAAALAAALHAEGRAAGYPFAGLVQARDEPAARLAHGILAAAMTSGSGVADALALLPGAIRAGTLLYPAAGLLLALGAVVDRAQALGVKVAAGAGSPPALVRVLGLRGTARLAALEGLRKAESRDAFVALLRVAEAVAPFVLRTDGRLPGPDDDTDAAPPPAAGTAAAPVPPPAPQPPVRVELAWPSEPVPIRVVSAPDIVTTTTVHKDEARRITGSTAVAKAVPSA